MQKYRAYKKTKESQIQMMQIQSLPTAVETADDLQFQETPQLEQQKEFRLHLFNSADQFHSVSVVEEGGPTLRWDTEEDDDDGVVRAFRGNQEQLDFQDDLVDMIFHEHTPDLELQLGRTMVSQEERSDFKMEVRQQR